MDSEGEEICDREECRPNAVPPVTADATSTVVVMDPPSDSVSLLTAGTTTPRSHAPAIMSPPVPDSQIITTHEEIMDREEGVNGKARKKLLEYGQDPVAPAIMSPPVPDSQIITTHEEMMDREEGVNGKARKKLPKHGQDPPSTRVQDHLVQNQASASSQIGVQWVPHSQTPSAPMSHEEEGGRLVEEEPPTLVHDAAVALANSDIFDDQTEGIRKEEEEADTPWWKRNQRIIFIGMILVFCGVVVVVVTQLLSSSPSESSSAKPVNTPTVESTSSPTIAPTPTSEDFAWCYQQYKGTDDNESVLNNTTYASIRSALVSSGISTHEEFSDAESYQRKALCWLAFGDRLKLEASDLFLEQRYALAAMFYRFDEPFVLLEEGWLSGKPECEWGLSIECDPRTRITRLSLSVNNMEGVLPKEMAALNDVKYLDLSYNLLEGNVSQAIGEWTHLEYLRLSNNNFETFPPFGDWKDLQHFDISSNGVEGNIPKSLALLPKLAHLNLGTNCFIGTIPAELGNLTSLQELYLHENLLDGSMPGSICDLRNIELEQLSVDCQKPNPEVECPLDCCTVCNVNDMNPFDRNPWG